MATHRSSSGRFLHLSSSSSESLVNPRDYLPGFFLSLSAPPQCVHFTSRSSSSSLPAQLLYRGALVKKRKTSKKERKAHGSSSRRLRPLHCLLLMVSHKTVKTLFSVYVSDWKSAQSNTKVSQSGLKSAQTHFLV